MAQKVTILVVDDELPVCKSISSALTTEQYTVDMALSAEEALRKEEESRYDVVITDLMMPGLSGMDLLRRLKEKAPDVKIIMITGYPSIKSAVLSIKLGAFDYIPKPFTPSELRALVARALESKRYHEEESTEKGTPGSRRRTKVALPDNTYCIPENSWARTEQDGNVRAGVHHVFLRTIENIASIDLPKKDEMRYQGEVCFRVTDSHAHVHKVWTPVSGKVVAVNEALRKDYSKLMEDPYGEGWVLVLKPTCLEEDLNNLTSLRSE
ncbi:MAG: response regulator [Candidatus Eisenbacteria bacterium]|nr:response regulator [Candidatus Eisenbacteria bacterium]